jgi:hypothetical protein
MAYIRVVQATYDPARAEEVTRLQGAFTSAIQRLPGLLQFYGGVDRSAGKTIAITIFDTQEHASFGPERLGDVGSCLREAGMQIESPAIYEAVE